MTDFGIKISKENIDVKLASNEELNFYSQFDIFKIAKTGSGSFNTGSSATIAHELGYPAAFLIYTSTDNTNFHLYGDGTRSYIDSTNLVIEKDRPITTNNYYMASGNDNFGDFQGGTYFVGYGAIVGRGSSNDIHGGMRFVNVTETSSITKAEVYFETKYPSPRTGTVEVITKGIDEDNTSDFSGNPLGRPMTSASITNSCDNGITTVWAYEVTNIFQEITGRSGWSSGNAMGFIFYNNANLTNHYIQSGSDTNSYLKVTKQAAVQTIYYKYVIFTHKIDSTKVLT